MKTAESMSSAAVAEIDLNSDDHLLQLAKVIHAKMPESRRISLDLISVDQIRNALERILADD